MNPTRATRTTVSPVSRVTAPKPPSESRASHWKSLINFKLRKFVGRESFPTTRGSVATSLSNWRMAFSLSDIRRDLKAYLDFVLHWWCISWAAQKQFLLFSRSRQQNLKAFEICKSNKDATTLIAPDSQVSSDTTHKDTRHKFLIRNHRLAVEMWQCLTVWSPRWFINCQPEWKI